MTDSSPPRTLRAPRVVGRKNVATDLRAAHQTALVLLALACGFALGAGSMLAVRRHGSVVRCDGDVRLVAVGAGAWSLTCEERR